MSTNSYFFLLLGPSGVGKSTLINKIITEIPKIIYYPSYTTRSPRSGEIDGKDYFFISQKEFEKRISKGFFLEVDKPHDLYYYGIAKEPLVSGLSLGNSFIKETAINALNELLKTDLSTSIVSFFLKPIQQADIKIRLQERNANNDNDRLKALEKEMHFEKSCLHTILIKHNDIDFGYKPLKKLLLKYLCKNNHF